MIKVVNYGKNKAVLVYLENMAIASNSNKDSGKEIALDMRNALANGVSLEAFEEERHSFIMAHTEGFRQKLDLICLDGLVKGVKDAYERDKRSQNKASLRPKQVKSVVQSNDNEL